MYGTEPIVYIDRSEVREGTAETLKAAIGELAEFVRDNEPRMLAYNVYFTQDGRRMTVIHIHPDSASLGFHMKLAGPAFVKFAEYVRILSIDIYGEINEVLLEQLRKKALTLGGASVAVHKYHAGFARFVTEALTGAQQRTLVTRT